MDKFKMGEFVADKEDKTLSDVGVIVFDHSVHGVDDFYSVRRLRDRHLSARAGDQLQHVSDFDAAVAFGCDAIEYSEDTLLKLKTNHTAPRPPYQPASAPLTEGRVISGGVAPPPTGPKPRVEVHGQGPRH